MMSMCIRWSFTAGSALGLMTSTLHIPEGARQRHRGVGTASLPALATLIRDSKRRGEQKGAQSQPGASWEEEQDLGRQPGPLEGERDRAKETLVKFLLPLFCPLPHRVLPASTHPRTHAHTHAHSGTPGVSPSARRNRAAVNPRGKKSE